MKKITTISNYRGGTELFPEQHLMENQDAVSFFDNGIHNLTVIDQESVCASGHVNDEVGACNYEERLTCGDTLCIGDSAYVIEAINYPNMMLVSGSDKRVEPIGVVVVSSLLNSAFWRV